MSRSVRKVWQDDGYEDERPESIQVELLRDGVSCSTVVLNDANNWCYTWDDLNGRSTYSVIERYDRDDMYYVECLTQGSTFVIINEYQGDIDDPETPYAARSGIGGTVVGDAGVGADNGNGVADGITEAVLQGSNTADYDAMDVENSVSGDALKALSAEAADDLKPLVDDTSDGPSFKFHVELYTGARPDGSGIPVEGVYPVISPPGRVIGLIENGKGEFSIGANQVFLIPGLPDGIRYVISEDEAAGYEQFDAFNAEGVTEKDVTSVVTVVNGAAQGDLELPSTGGPGIGPYIATGFAMGSMACLAVLFTRRRHMR